MLFVSAKTILILGSNDAQASYSGMAPEGVLGKTVYMLYCLATNSMTVD